MYNRVFDDRAEQAVIGAILIDPAVCDEVATVVKPSDFYVDKNRRIYQRLLDMNADGAIDLTLLVEELRKSNELEEVGGEVYLGEIMLAVHSTAHAVQYANIVAQRAMRRNMIDACESALSDANSDDVDIKELIAKVEERVFAINEDRTTSALSASEILPDVFHILDRRATGAIDGVTTGFSELDRMLGGLHNSDFIVLAARPSMGKTALATNIAAHVAMNEHKTILFFSLEMSKNEVMIRIINSRACIPNQQYKYGLSQSEKARFDDTVEQLRNTPLFIDDTSNRTVSEIAAVARRTKRKHGLALIVIDYISLITPDSTKEPRHEQVAAIARRLKGLARDLDVPVLCLAQLNRAAEQAKDNRPKMSNLRESGAIEQDADVVMFIHREEYYMTKEEAEDKGLRGQADLIVAKHRNGPVGDIKLLWKANCTLFMDVPQVSSEYEGDFQNFS